MHDNIDANRTNRQLLKSISTPVGRYYPLDLHVHSLGSYDVCQSDRYGRLPQQLRTDIEIAIEGTSIQLPLRKQPPDAGKHDQELASNSHLVNAYYKAILERKRDVATAAGTADGDDWSVVGLTDHNVCEFSCALSALSWERRRDDRLILLPGIELDVEFAVDGGSSLCRVHILSLFAPCSTSSDIRLALNAAIGGRSPGWKFGEPLVVDDLAAFIGALRSHKEYPAICVAAHVWSSRGIANEPKQVLLKALDADLARIEGELERARGDAEPAEIEDLEKQLAELRAKRADDDALHGNVLALIGKCGFDALQIKNQSQEVHYRRLHRFRDNHGRSVPIVCSDAHNPLGIFNCGGGVPFGKISSRVLSNGTAGEIFEELRGRTLRFGETRMTYASPGKVTYWIEGLEIAPDSADARRFWQEAGRDSKVFTLCLSRNLNCFVGGRGSGKSAGVEAVAFLTREQEFQEEAQKPPKDQAHWYRRASATLSGCRIRLVWKTTATTGIGLLPKRALIVSRYFDPDGQHEVLDVRDADGQAVVDDNISLPQVRIFRVHEIEEAAQPDNLRRLFDDLCGSQIRDLTSEIDNTRKQLVAQRSDIVAICRELDALTQPGSPLRQYGVRKKQFEEVNRADLKERFEAVDLAEEATRTAAGIDEKWHEIDASTTLETLHSDLNGFFDLVTTEILGEQEQSRPGHEGLLEVFRQREPESPSPRGEITAAIQTGKEAVDRFEKRLQSESETLKAALKTRRDALAQAGLPVGASQRESKKRAFDAAEKALETYQSLLHELSGLLDARTSLHEVLVAKCKQRTELRQHRAKELTAQLRRDLDPGILSIEIDAHAMAERIEFNHWLERNMDGAFRTYSQHRRDALLESGVMPAQLRSLFLDDGTPSLRILRNERERVRDGRIDENDAELILARCRGRKRVPLDEAASWAPEFKNSLPDLIRDGVVTFPASASGDSLCIDEVLQLDEVVLDDVPEVRLNDRPRDHGAEPRPLDQLSPGQRCSAILPILLLSGDYPLVIDQPEENLDNRLIRQVIVNILGSMKLRRQVIIATHNPNLPVLGDVEQCVILQATGRDLSSVVAVGDLDSSSVAKYITDIMEGGREAFQYRQSIYQSHWRGVVEE